LADFLLILLPFPLVVIAVVWLVVQSDLSFDALLVRTHQGTVNAFSVEEIRDGVRDKLKLAYILLANSEIPAHSRLPAYKIIVGNNVLDSLNSLLPASGDIYHKAYLEVDKNAYKVKVRYRGDNYWHWIYPKKSWRIKMRKKQILDGQRLLNFINPKSRTIIDNCLADSLASLLGILAPHHSFVQFYVNNRYMGVYDMVDQIDEHFLRRQHQMPGNIYYGEEGIFKPMWKEASSWEKPSSRSSGEKSDERDLQYFLDVLNKEPVESGKKALENILDTKKYLGMYALDQVLGIARQDTHHNHKLYFEAWKGKFEPVVWDVTGNELWPDPQSIFLNTPFNPIYGKMFIYPEFIEEKDRILWQAIQGRLSTKNINALIDSMCDLIRPDVYADLNKDYVDETRSPFRKRPFTNQEFENHIEFMKLLLEQRQEFVRQELSRNSLAMCLHQERNRDARIVGVIDAYADEEAGSLLNELNVSADSGAFLPAGEYELWRDSNLNSSFDESDVRISAAQVTPANAHAVQFHLSELLLPGRSKAPHREGREAYLSYTLRRSPLKYTFFLISRGRPYSGGEHAPHLKITAEAKNSVTGDPSKVQILTSAEALDRGGKIGSYSYHPWLEGRLPRPQKRVFAGGDHTVRQDLVFAAHDTVIIEPGARFLIDSGKSIVSDGVVISHGTAKNPVVFTALDKTRPWGIVALHGEKSMNSTFTHCIFEYGGIAPPGLILHTGMVNIHYSSARFDSCLFRRNRVGDDGVHGVHSVVNFSACTFDSICSDAIDFDYSNGIISHCIFKQSKGDAIDLMTSNPVIEYNYVSGAADKGVSVGEMSSPTVFNNVFTRNSKGLAIKDRSNPLIVNNIIMENDSGITAYEKNTHYGGGGLGTVANTILRDNGINFQEDKKSDVSIIYSNTPAEKDEHCVDVPVNLEVLRKMHFVLSADQTAAQELATAGSPTVLKKIKKDIVKQKVPIGLITPLYLPEDVTGLASF
jgi:parallel beta-helix repeat protein